MAVSNEAESLGSIPDVQLALIARIARSWARDQDEQHLFDDGRSSQPSEEGLEVYESYMEDTRCLLDGAFITPLLTFAEILSRQPPGQSTPSTDAEAVRNHIADRLAEVAVIDDQLTAFERGEGPARGRSWTGSAKAARRAKLLELALAYRLLVRLEPSCMEAGDKLLPFAPFNPGQAKQQIETLKAQLTGLQNSAARKKKAYVFNLAREEVKSRAILAYLRERAPEHLEQVFEAIDRAQAEIDEDVQTVSTESASEVAA